MPGTSYKVPGTWYIVFLKILKNVSCEYDGWVVETLLYIAKKKYSCSFVPEGTDRFTYVYTTAVFLLFCSGSSRSFLVIFCSHISRFTAICAIVFVFLLIWDAIDCYVCTQTGPNRLLSLHTNTNHRTLFIRIYYYWYNHTAVRRTTRTYPLNVIYLHTTHHQTTTWILTSKILRPQFLKVLYTRSRSSRS